MERISSEISTLVKRCEPLIHQASEASLRSLSLRSLDLDLSLRGEDTWSHDSRKGQGVRVSESHLVEMKLLEVETQHAASSGNAVGSLDFSNLFAQSHRERLQQLSQQFRQSQKAQGRSFGLLASEDYLNDIRKRQKGGVDDSASRDVMPWAEISADFSCVSGRGISTWALAMLSCRTLPTLSFPK